MTTKTATRTVQTSSGPKTLVGPEVRPGDQAPTNVTLTRTDMSAASLSEHRGMPRLYSVTPSLDTSLCNKQTVTFNGKLADLKGDYHAFAISVDLPPAQKRFVDEHHIEHLTALSDYKDVEFGQQFGVLLKEIRFLARSVFVVDRNDRVTHVQLMDPMGTEPDYDKAIAALKDAMNR